jgi:hypothetical protein
MYVSSKAKLRLNTKLTVRLFGVLKINFQYKRLQMIEYPQLTKIK